jgi:alkylation response protein AidB-like acyl-CoA dehydrogenase
VTTASPGEHSASQGASPQTPRPGTPRGPEAPFLRHGASAATTDGTKGARSDAVPDLGYSEAEEQLRTVVRGLLADRSPWPAVLARVDAGEADDVPLWHTMAAGLGCAGLLIPESYGGAGASYREAAVVAEETGRAAACVPYLTSAVMATTALLGTGDGELLGGLASGRLTAALAVGFGTMPPAPGAAAGPWPVRVGPPRDGDAPGTARLSGTVGGVAGALAADVLLVPGDGVPFRLYAVDAAAAGVTRKPLVSLDATRPLADVTLDNVPGRQVATGPDAVRAVAAALTAGAGLLASEQFGVAEGCLGMTVTYVKERRQFARPVGSFQALKHRLADVWMAVTQARAAARYAAACLATGDPDTPVAVALAKAAAGDAAVLAAQECVQLHGGIGFTWEHPAHLLLKRAKSGSMALGTPDRHRAALAALVDLPPPPGG